jgi:hypothetical protein
VFRTRWRLYAVVCLGAAATIGLAGPAWADHSACPRKFLLLSPDWRGDDYLVLSGALARAIEGGDGE